MPAISLVLLLVSCGSLKEAKLNMPTWFGMVKISPGLYVSENVTDEQREQLLSSIQQAKSQVMQVYGSVISRVIIYACGDRECYESFNGYGDGKAIGDSGILLTPKSFIPEAISHEWSHVELHTRVGSAGYRKIPMWFHEGLAVVVSKLPNHSEKVLRQAEQLGLPVPMDVKQFGELTAWKSALKQYHNDKGLSVFYAAAGQEVRKWLKGVGTEGLIQLIDAVHGGENFMVAYEGMEKRLTPGKQYRKLRTATSNHNFDATRWHLIFS